MSPKGGIKPHASLYENAKLPVIEVATEKFLEMIRPTSVAERKDSTPYVTPLQRPIQ
jgi:hypothetical protein